MSLDNILLITGLSETVPPTPPTITVQPESIVDLTVGDTLNLSVTATGTEPLSYQWRKNGVSVVGETSSSFQILNAQESDAGTYSVLVTNSAGSALSDDATVSVSPVIDFLLDNYTGAVGFSLRKLRDAYAGDAIEVRRASDDTTLDIGFVGEDLDTAAIETFCAGTTGYVSKWYDQVGSNDAVQSTLTAQPIIYESGAVVVNEFGRPAVRFFDDNTAAIESRLNTSGFWAALDAPWVAVSAVYSLNAITAGAAIAVHYGNMMRMSHFDGRPRAQIVRDGGGAFTTAAISDIPELNTTTVRLDSADKSFLSIWLNLSATPAAQTTDKTGDITSAFVSYIGDGTDNNSTHDFLISEIVGFDTDESANNLAIRTNQSEYWKPITAPLITVQPADVVDLTVGDTLALYVTATGPGLSYQWVKDSANITGETTATLEITNAQESDSGTYYVVVSNSEGSVNSEESLVTILAAPVAPTITVQPSASESLEVGDTLTLTVTATGDSPLSYQWRVGGVNIPGETSPTLQIVNVQESDAGTYSVVVTNPAGSATSNNSVVSVSVPTPVAPTITVQPQASVSLTVGDTLNLSVTATGTAPLSYQWKVGGVDITGETASSLEIPNVQEADAGTYTVAVTNSAGTATSNNSVVSVSVPVPNSVYQRPDGSDIFQPDGTSQYVRP